MPSTSEFTLDQFRSFAMHAKEAGLGGALVRGAGRAAGGVAHGVGKATWGTAKAMTKSPLAAAGLTATGVGTMAVGGPAVAKSIAQKKNFVQQPWTQRGF